MVCVIEDSLKYRVMILILPHSLYIYTHLTRQLSSFLIPKSQEKFTLKCLKFYIQRQKLIFEMKLQKGFSNVFLNEFKTSASLLNT